MLWPFVGADPAPRVVFAEVEMDEESDDDFDYDEVAVDRSPHSRALNPHTAFSALC